MTLDSTTIIALRATPSGRCRFWRMPASWKASLVGSDAVHQRAYRFSPGTDFDSVLAMSSSLIRL